MFKFLSQNDMELSAVIVISPLVALMQYQAAQLTKKGVRAVYLQDVISETSNSPQIILEDISSGKCDVVFVTWRIQKFARQLVKQESVKSYFF